MECKSFARAVAMVISLGLLSAGLTGQVQTSVDPASYPVYRALIPKQWPVSVAKAKRIILKLETVTYSRCVPRGRPLQEEWKPVVDDFTLQNSGPRTLQPGFDLGIDYLLIPTMEIQSAFTGNGDWREFYARYPDSGGFIDVSAVGFDPSKARAMVYIAHHCGGLCGGGTFHFMEKTDGQWREAAIKDLENCMWIS